MRPGYGKCRNRSPRTLPAARPSTGWHTTDTTVAGSQGVCGLVWGRKEKITSDGRNNPGCPCGRWWRSVYATSFPSGEKDQDLGEPLEQLFGTLITSTRSPRAGPMSPGPKTSSDQSSSSARGERPEPPRTVDWMPRWLNAIIVQVASRSTRACLRALREQLVRESAPTVSRPRALERSERGVCATRKERRALERSERGVCATRKERP
jgi:hypothetical protein